MDNIKTGALIRERRKEKGLTQRELAERLHVTDRAVSKWERGLSNIELLRQATVNSAIIAGVIDKAGTIKVGKWADFCIVDGKPDEDIDVMTKLPAHVIIGGQKAV